ncbi:MAG TPA: 16S rRNA (guanine(527)-N(7))-methyltransferase RsmG [Collinsella intestinalis]|nr:16S rRNA (guanine(527)-N(7))-methyltransferase RsmG [Collinsella intestinalis]
MANETSRTITLRPFDESVDEIAALVTEVVDLASELDIELDVESAERCVQHLLYVNQVNQVMNLTRIKDIHDALVLHIVDSLALYRDLPIDPEHFLDMGTGAGFPGIPFALYTGCSGVLLDSVGKKIDAVNAFIDALGIEDVEGIHDRCESYAMKMRGRFDTVFARAVGQMSMIIEYGTPFLEDDGYLVVAKANPEASELKLAEKTAAICGLELIGCDEFDLPRGLGHRSVFLYQKVSEPQIKLPRAVGLAKKQPLAS